MKWEYKILDVYEEQDVWEDLLNEEGESRWELIIHWKVSSAKWNKHSFLFKRHKIEIEDSK